MISQNTLLHCALLYFGKIISSYGSMRSINLYFSGLLYYWYYWIWMKGTWAHFTKEFLHIIQIRYSIESLPFGNFITHHRIWIVMGKPSVNCALAQKYSNINKAQTVCQCLRMNCTCHYIDGLVQERRNSSALAMELCLACTNPPVCLWWKNRIKEWNLFTTGCFFFLQKHSPKKLIACSWGQAMQYLWDFIIWSI